MSTSSHLSGSPLRASQPLRLDGLIQATGFLKLHLGHSKNGSVLVPTQLFSERNGWHFYQPSFFGPPILGFNIEPNLHIACFNLDVCGPYAIEATRVVVKVRSDQLVRRYDDGAQLYKCVIEGPAFFADQAAGRAEQLPNEDFALQLFHITNLSAAEGISESKEIWSSAWNIQGTRKLKNVAYGYFTSLSAICNEGDLKRIAMSSDGVLHLQTTSNRPQELIHKICVYRDSTPNRSCSIPVKVPTDFIAPPHLLLHRPPDQAYYEIIGPEIYRVGVKPGELLSYCSGRVFVNSGNLKRFSYIVVGDAAEIDGLAAPFDEEETNDIVHIEKLDNSDVFKFWQMNANSDQMSGRSFESRNLE